MNELLIYNLEFPDYINELNIGGYNFKRTTDYPTAFAGLQHRVDSFGGEFPTHLNTGTHQHTAFVELPQKEDDAVLPWSKEYRHTKMYDVLLLLTLFTGRNVFVISEEEKKYPIRKDAREHVYGGAFHLSIKRDFKWKRERDGKIISREELGSQPVFGHNPIELGFEATINEVLVTIATKEWQEKYDGGYFLFTFRQAMGQNDIEPAFILCWTIWEHLFAVHNKNWLDNSTIEQMSGDKKVSFILNKYLLINIDEKAMAGIKRISKARNRLIHYGKKPNDVDFKEMELVIRLTEQIMAIVLNLQPSNVFNSFEALQKLLNK